ncbi:YjbF family lipoprotein [Gammaproteobacteria bacterium]|jgi:hypothetical protein|nr:YjbF family lipoprotein [Gammaproteobacteria bacterium]
MIRLFFILLFLTSCGNLPITYIQNFGSVNNVVFGFSDYKVTQEIFDEYEYSFMKVRFGRGPHSILILAYENDGVYEWVGQDDVQIFTKNGRVLKTLGLAHNLEITKAHQDRLSMLQDSYESINLYNPDLYSATMYSTFRSKEVKIKRLEAKIDVLRIKEVSNVSAIGWKETNFYFKSLASNEIVQTHQNIHPRLPVLKIEFYYKF